ncbi:hypothetical protein CBR_g54916 [Chara braunii]|uniref:Myb/SANT-like DNA-binding domain-containing protein n=1 Tax=Chara braunii TaxID=69332 RepID=A0A388JPT6_CHABU|nr:hypothetical protein CBR_g54916 [Chara braunii]|eukprot:GBG59814.1 hypothetical protein CBR_g54916 [Chara braunii]
MPEELWCEWSYSQVTQNGASSSGQTNAIVPAQEAGLLVLPAPSSSTHQELPTGSEVVPAVPRQGWWRSNQGRFNEMYWWSAEKEAREVAQREKERLKVEEEEKVRKEREAENRRKERREFHQEMSEVLSPQLKEICATIVGPCKIGEATKEDEAARLRRENEEFRKSMESRLEKPTLENEVLKMKVHDSNQESQRSGSKRRVVDRRGSTYAAYKRISEDNEAMKAEIRLLKEMKIHAQVESVELRKKLTGKTPCPARSDLRVSFEEAADSDDEDGVEAHLTRNSKEASVKGQALRMVVFEKKVRRELRGLRKNQAQTICDEEVVEFVTIKQAIDSIVEKRLDKEFGSGEGEVDPKSGDLPKEGTEEEIASLILAVVVFLIIIFLHVCLSWRPWKQQRKRRASTRRAAGERLMAGMQARAATAAGQGGVRTSAAEPPRRYDPSMYTHLESWETPLPPSDEEPEKEELSMLPLASGSTELWSQTVRAGGSAADEGGEFTEASRMFIINGDRSARGLEHGGSLHTEQSTLRRAAPVTGAVTPSLAGRQHGSTAPSVERLTPTWPTRTGVASGPLRMGGARSPMPACTTPIESELRDERTCRAPVRSRPTVENITRGVSNMRAHSDGGEDDGGFGDDADEGMREDVEAGDDDDNVPIRPLGKMGGRGKGRGRGGVRGRSVACGSRGGVSDDAGKSSTYWSAEDQMLLVRCKREQDMHLAGLSHNYGQMKTKEWKWDDMSKRMANAGRPQDVDDCMKKWDNLFQNYKKVQRFQNASGQADFFRLTNEERKEHNFKFRMDRALYSEIHAGMVGNHMIFPPNVADTGSPEGVQLHRRGAGGRESVCSEAAGEGCPGERSSARESDNNAVSGAGGGRREAGSGRTRAAEEDNADDFTMEDEQGKATASAAWESVRQRSSDQSTSKRMFTPPPEAPEAPEAQQLRGCETLKKKGDVVDVGSDDDEPLEKCRLRTATQSTAAVVSTARAAADKRPTPGTLPSTPSQPRQRNDGASVQHGGGRGVVADAQAGGGEAAGGVGVGVVDVMAPVPAAREEAAVLAMVREEGHGHNKNERDGGEAASSRARRGVMTKKLIDRALLWVDDKAFWLTSEGRRLYNIVHETKEYFVAIASGLPPPDLPRSVVLPKSSTRVARISDQSQLQQAISRAAAVENIALRSLHDWVFKSGNRPRGPEDDDMAAHQESIVIAIAHSFCATVQMGAHIDGDFVSYKRLCRVAECFRLLLAASMCIMRMAGDDPRSHYEAFYFADLVARPTLVASMHRSFDHRRSVVRATNVVTERLGKVKATLGVYPDYIPDWGPCSIGFAHDASIKGPEDAKRLDWLGSGPPDDDNKGEGKDDA